MQRQLLHGFDETAAMNQKHLEQWGLLAPGKGESGDGGGGLPAWLSALLKRLDRLESQVWIDTHTHTHTCQSTLKSYV